MLSSSDLSFSRNLPLAVFNQLEELLQQMAQSVGNTGLILTEAVLARIYIPREWQNQKFTVVVSEQFSVLLLGSFDQGSTDTQEERRKGEHSDLNNASGDKSTEPTTVATTEGTSATHCLPNALAPQHSATPLATTEETSSTQWLLSTQQRQSAQVGKPFRQSLMGSHSIVGVPPVEESGVETPKTALPHHAASSAALNAKLTFHSEAIASFLSELKELFVSDSNTHQNLEHYIQILRPNDAKLQSKFTLLLLDYLLPQNQEKAPESLSANPTDDSIFQAMEKALKTQIYQERLLNQVTTQIRKSLDLPVIMATAIAQVRDFLALDRLVIYKFEGSRGNSLNSTINEQNSSQPPIQDWQKYGGCIVYEARGADTIPSVLHYQEKNCFIRTSACWDKYRQGFTLVVDDVEKTYALEECLLNFLRTSRVRAKLAAPIMFEEKLWGLLIAHQCDSPRQWNENEKSLLTSIAEQLAIAIHQSELMRSLTQEKQTLEQRVLERTMALRDALLAAEAASRLRNEFLATISHELLTPLTYVIGMSSTLLRWPIGELSQRQRDYLQTIHDSGEHLLEMINDILDLSQIEAGKTVLNINEFSLAKMAENAISALLDKATNEQVNLKLDLQIDPRRDRFSADAERIEQILWNLLTNAIKFTPEGGSVTLRIWVEDNTAIFQVEDTGIGISEEQLPLMFEKFQQLDTPYRRRYEGTGLGLALTKQLVELHRGRIEVESTVGIGSIFTVWIPAQSVKVLSAES